MSSGYKLWFHSMEIGDELIVSSSEWKGTTRRSQSGQLQPIQRLDSQPLGLVLYPRFRVRKVFDDFIEFERWVFDLCGWADGQARYLLITDSSGTLKVDYSWCKLLALSRPKAGDSVSGRWSDQVILEFQSDTIPQFHNMD